MLHIIILIQHIICSIPLARIIHFVFTMILKLYQDKFVCNYGCRHGQDKSSCYIEKFLSRQRNDIVMKFIGKSFNLKRSLKSKLFFLLIKNKSLTSGHQAFSGIVRSTLIGFLDSLLTSADSKRTINVRLIM